MNRRTARPYNVTFLETEALGILWVDLNSLEAVVGRSRVEVS